MTGLLELNLQGGEDVKEGDERTVKSVSVPPRGVLFYLTG
jgi:hypothetical protein